MRIRSIALTLAAAGTAIFAGAVPAQAHATSYDYYIGCGVAGLEDCGHASVTSTHKTITICDDSADGDVPFVQYVRGGVTYKLTDGNGSKSGCSSDYDSTSITKWRMCVDFGSYNTCIKDWITA